jgi:tripartite-type tricarboxylate transporter receptor subunit TctC
MSRKAKGVAIAFVLAIPLLAHAADWPTKPVRIIVPYVAGGSADTIGRSFANQLSQEFNQTFVIENRGGAAGMIGSTAVAHADPNGYTLLISGRGSHVIGPDTTPNPGYDPIRDFTHIAYFGGAPMIIVVHPSLGVKSLTELLELATKGKEALSYVSPGVGTLGNLLAEYWAHQQKMKLEHIPYKGGAEAMNDLIAGHVKVGAVGLAAAMAQIRAGSLLPLAVTSSARVAEFPDLKTFKELGYADMVVTNWFALSGPKGLPGDVVQEINAAVEKAKNNSDVQRRLAIEAIQTEPMSSAEFTTFVKAEIAKWGPVAKEVMKPDRQ